MLKIGDDLDLDWTHTKSPVRPARRSADPEPTNNDIARYALFCAVVAAILAVLTAAFLIGRWTLADDLEAATESASRAEVMAGAATDEAAEWERRYVSLEASVADLASEVASATEAAELWEARALDASATAAAVEADNEALKRDLARINQMGTSVPSTVTVIQALASGTTWSKAQVASTLTAAATTHGLTDAQTAWIVDTGCRIAYRESTYRTAVVNASGHAGLFQFSKSWGTLGERTDPVWSCYRFVRVYAEGGESAIRRHWRATV